MARQRGTSGRRVGSSGGSGVVGVTSRGEPGAEVVPLTLVFETKLTGGRAGRQKHAQYGVFSVSGTWKTQGRVLNTRNSPMWVQFWVFAGKGCDVCRQTPKTRPHGRVFGVRWVREGTVVAGRKGGASVGLGREGRHGRRVFDVSTAVGVELKSVKEI